MMSWISALALVAALQAPDPDASRADRAAPADWARQPSAGDLARFYPERATRDRISGDVTLACRVDAKGALSDCGVVAETPSNYGFGLAALKIAETYLMRADRAERWAANDRRVLLPIVFRPPGAARPSPPSEWVPRGDLRRRLPRGEPT